MHVKEANYNEFTIFKFSAHATGNEHQNGGLFTALITMFMREVMLNNWVQTFEFQSIFQWICWSSAQKWTEWAVLKLN